MNRRTKWMLLFVAAAAGCQSPEGDNSEGTPPDASLPSMVPDLSVPATNDDQDAGPVDAGAPLDGFAPPLTLGTLVFDEEFDGPAGTAPNSKVWTYDTGGDGWGNQEREYYTNTTDNSALDGNGHLAMVARTDGQALNCWYGQCQYTSARLKTQGLFSQQYGRVEARIQIPAGQGVWPAFWMLGNNINTVSWPACGEVDIMENIGKEPNDIHGTIHGPGYSGANGISSTYQLSSGNFSDDFHVFALEWDPHQFRFYMDSALYKTTTINDIPNGDTWVYDQPFFLILDLAIGGSWPGDPDANTKFPATMLVDYVRVYEPYETPYLGMVHSLPGTVQAEDFDYGLEGSAYHSLDATNMGGQYRVIDETVGIEMSQDVDSGYSVGWTAAGEWLKYSAVAGRAGDYTLGLRVASDGQGGTLHVEWRGVDVTGPITVGDTGGWHTWQTLTLPGIDLGEAGPGWLRIVFDQNGAGGSVANINWMTLQ